MVSLLLAFSVGFALNTHTHAATISTSLYFAFYWGLFGGSRLCVLTELQPWPAGRKESDSHTGVWFWVRCSNWSLVNKGGFLLESL